MAAQLTRRALLRGGGAVGLATLIPAEILAACGTNPPPNPFSDHQMSLLTESTARLIPGPQDDPAELGHPGAREADAARYIATLVGALAYNPPRVYAGGPFSNRSGAAHDDMADFLTPSRTTRSAWRDRLAAIRDSYMTGLAELDRRARTVGVADFLTLEAAAKDRVLATNFKVARLPGEFSGFTDMLFHHSIEGTYSAPEYGGNHGLAGWRDVGFRGDMQPRGYTAEEVSAPLNDTRLVPGPAVAALLEILSATSPPPMHAP
ncbi:MAG TPA: gluconate 2-dehydrogenase subunit 3 family protein [Acidimicrobiales bacterium]|nr:gluconate 2-dehydrogenase subunit 3 family protein [Acidimicrobiales bacterium]